MLMIVDNVDSVDSDNTLYVTSVSRQKVRFPSILIIAG